MIGLSEYELVRIIDSGAFSNAPLMVNIREEESKRLVNGIAKAIEANNKRITEQLAVFGFKVYTIDN
jgi:hypothetical protein